MHGSDSNAELSKLDYRNNRGLDRALIRSLSQGNWLTLKQNILLTGPPAAVNVPGMHLVIMPADRDTRSTIIAFKALDGTVLSGHADGRYSKL